MTTHELRKIREEMQQSPRTMADKLGINVNTYYLWERGREVPQYFALAIRFLATQNLPKDPHMRRRPDDARRTQFSPGARFGRLVVLGDAPPTKGSRHCRVKVQCDCGEETVMRATNLVDATRCGCYCRLNGTPLPTPEVTTYKPYTPTAYVPPPPPESDPDEPDLDAPEVEWLKYHDRKAKRVAAAAAAAAAAEGDNEWEEGL